ncbi:hypothetical protein TH63_06550 [Rufibacter radiotolerans]|uniref:Uncharacterized protein n=1 Tax=Rufibacter radiotolerans TaxID=1379910 RepID=A0A0H4VNR2_9BACT|nr:hypothetical protein TH63_06550 [Rufibacter radiotolerans]
MFSSALLGCSDIRDCNCLDYNEVLIQELKSSANIIKLTKVEQGAFGSTINLKVCNTSNMLIEEIGLRGDDYLPTIDSITGKKIFIHYSFPSNNNSDPIDRDLKFESVALGEALLDSSSLRFSYMFKNKK